MTVLYPNPCYNKVCYKGVTLYLDTTSTLILWLSLVYMYVCTCFVICNDNKHVNLYTGCLQFLAHHTTA